MSFRTDLLILAAKSKALEGVYQPLFFRLKDEESKAKLNHLLYDIPNIEVYDEILGQVEELVKSQNPKIVFGKEQLTEAAKKHIGDGNREEYGVWVYYPWAKRLIHILDEKEFIEVRTNRNNYKITPAERDLLSKKTIGVIGLSVGQSIALTIAMERTCGELRIADFDILELSNLNRIRAGLQNLGIAKTVVVAREIAEIDPYFKVTCFNEGINEDNIDDFIAGNGKLDVLVDESDGLYIKILCRQKAKIYGIPVVMDTSDRGMIDVERFDLEPDRSVFHGLIDHLDINKVKEAKTNEEKVPFLLPMVGMDTVSTRLKASMVEIEQSITSWPQLASSVVLGGGLGADVCRRILLDQYHDSGRYFMDVEELIADREKNVAQEKSVQVRSPLSEEVMNYLISHFEIAKIDGQLKLDNEVVEELVAAAILAPTAANGQPWKWRYIDGILYLFFDCVTKMALDCDYSMSIVGVGAAVENLVLKAHSMGFEVLIDSPQLDKESKLIAAIRFFDKVTHEVSHLMEPHICDELADAIPIRMTNRIVGKREKIDEMQYAMLENIARTVPGADLKIIHDDARLFELGEIIGKMDKARMMHAGGHFDFFAEIRWTKEEAEESKDGIDLQGTVDLTASELIGLKVAVKWPVIKMLRDWGLGTGLERIGRKSVGAASAMALVTVPSFAFDKFFEGGRVVERVWLEANNMGIAVHPFGLLFNAYEYGDKSAFEGKMKDELIECHKKFAEIFSIEKPIGEVLLLRLFKAGTPMERSARYSIGTDS